MTTERERQNLRLSRVVRSLTQRGIKAWPASNHQPYVMLDLASAELLASVLIVLDESLADATRRPDRHPPLKEGGEA